MNIYISMIKVMKLKGCELNLQEGELAYTQCFIPAESEKQAAETLFEVLEELHLEFISEEYLVIDSDFDRADSDNQEIFELVDEAKELEEVIFSDFYPAPHEESGTQAE
jgi:hypothetical protein